MMLASLFVELLYAINKYISSKNNSSFSGISSSRGSSSRGSSSSSSSSSGSGNNNGSVASAYEQIIQELMTEPTPLTLSALLATPPRVYVRVSVPLDPSDPCTCYPRGQKFLGYLQGDLTNHYLHFFSLLHLLLLLLLLLLLRRPSSFFFFFLCC